MGETARRELKELLDSAAARVREAEAGAEAALRNRYDKEAHRACLEEKCRILMGLPEAARPALERLEREDPAGAGSARIGLEGFAARAGQALGVGSVFYMRLLLYPEDYRDGDPNDLERFVAGFERSGETDA